MNPYDEVEADIAQEAWLRKYRPICPATPDEHGNIPSYSGSGGAYELDGEVHYYGMFETYGDELQQVLDASDDCVWTLIECDDATGEHAVQYLVPGYHLVNRLGYYVTSVPFEKNAADVVWWHDSWYQ